MKKRNSNGKQCNVTITEGEPIVCDGCKKKIYKAITTVLQGYLILHCPQCSPNKILEKKRKHVFNPT